MANSTNSLIEAAEIIELKTGQKVKRRSMALACAVASGNSYAVTRYAAAYLDACTHPTTGDFLPQAKLEELVGAAMFLDKRSVSRLAHTLAEPFSESARTNPISGRIRPLIGFSLLSNVAIPLALIAGNSVLANELHQAISENNEKVDGSKVSLSMRKIDVQEQIARLDKIAEGFADLEPAEIAGYWDSPTDRLGIRKAAQIQTILRAVKLEIAQTEDPMGMFRGSVCGHDDFAVRSL